MGTSEFIDESFWETKSKSVLNVAKKIYELTNEIYEDTRLGFNKTNITINSHGYNQMYFKKRYEDAVLIIFRYGDKKEEIEKVLQDDEISYTDDNKRFKFQLYEKQIEEKIDIFAEIARLNNKWWIG